MKPQQLMAQVLASLIYRIIFLIKSRTILYFADACFDIRQTQVADLVLQRIEVHDEWTLSGLKYYFQRKEQRNIIDQLRRILSVGVSPERLVRRGVLLQRVIVGLMAESRNRRRMPEAVAGMKGVIA